jgi:LysM repeat protein
MLRTSLFRFVLLILASVVWLSALPTAVVMGASNAEYVIQPGDSLYGIANRYEITIDQLLTVNPGLQTSSVIQPGQVILLPVGRGEGVLPTPPRRMFFWEVEKNGGRVEQSDHLYRIVSGDNYYRIARRYGITFADLVAANPQSSADHLTRGELIHIPIEKLGEGVYTFYETPGGPPASTSR